MIILEAPAKINVGLWVEGRRSDGYHALRSLFFPVSLYDTLSFEAIPQGIELCCCEPHVPFDSANLAWKAADLYFTYTGVRSGVKITLKKRIPVGHGLGGGSSDASVTLLGLDKLFHTSLSYVELESLALELGMDCPFFLNPRPSLVTGRGEEIEQIEVPAFDLLIYAPDFGVSTVWAYRHLTRLTNGVKPCKLLLQALVERRYRKAACWLFNSFEEVVYARYPELERMAELLKEKGAWFAGLSGSGSAIYAAVEPDFNFALPMDIQGRLIRARTL